MSQSLLVLIAEDSVIYNPHRALSRTSRLMPVIRAQIMPDVSHALVMKQADPVNARRTVYIEE